MHEIEATKPQQHRHLKICYITGYPMLVFPVIENVNIDQVFSLVTKIKTFFIEINLYLTVICKNHSAIIITHTERNNSQL